MVGWGFGSKKKRSTSSSSASGGKAKSSPLLKQQSSHIVDPDDGRSIYDDYDIVQEIGRGAFSRCYHARRFDNDKDVAVKVMAIERFDEEMRNIVENEIHLMKRVRKELPNFQQSLVQIEDVIREDDRICICMEYVPNGELFDRIVEKSHYTERDASMLMAKLVRAVKALHKIGIIHRDLKPENILVGRSDSDIKLIDFGLALCIGRDKKGVCIEPDDDPHQSVPFVGSPGYVAPEVLLHQEYGTSNEVWSLGVILYILLVGRAPFQTRTQEQQFERITTGTYSLEGAAWDEISDSAKDLVRRMLDVDTTSRITMGQILRHPWIFNAHLREASKHLGSSLVDLRKFNNTRKVRIAAEKALGQASADLRTALMGLLEKSTTHTAGLSTADIAKIITALRKFSGKRKLTKDEFIKILSDLGFKSLPLEEMFDVLVGQTQSKTSLMVKSKQEVKTVLEVDEIVVGLSVIAAKEGRERVLQYLFDFLSDYQEGGNQKSSSIPVSGFAKVLTVLASYQKPTDETARKRHIANNVASIFVKSSSPEKKRPSSSRFSFRRTASTASADSQISFEQFKQGVLQFGDDVLQDFVFAPLQYIYSSVEQADKGIITNRAPYKSLVSYLSKMTEYTKTINGAYDPASKSDDELENDDNSE